MERAYHQIMASSSSFWCVYALLVIANNEIAQAVHFAVSLAGAAADMQICAGEVDIVFAVKAQVCLKLCD